jgi:hypothetical protein
MKSPLWLKTLSTGYEHAEKQKTLSYNGFNGFSFWQSSKIAHGSATFEFDDHIDR